MARRFLPPLATPFATTIFALALAASVEATDDHDQLERQTLEAAVLRAGKAQASLPIFLAATTPAGASAGVEGWTVSGRDGKGERIFIYSGSAIFRCAMRGNNHRCQLRLASVIVHEAWHLTRGSREDGAYAAQIAFLMGNQGDPDQIAGVRMARDRAIADLRRALDAAKKPAAVRPGVRAEEVQPLLPE
jgi:hypothetical protein